MGELHIVALRIKIRVKYPIKAVEIQPQTEKK
jgi:hypothetical protein